MLLLSFCFHFVLEVSVSVSVSSARMSALSEEEIDLEILENVEFAGARDSTEVLRTNLSRCVICKIGEIVPKVQSKEKDHLFVYGRNGLRKVKHEDSHCNFQV